MRNQLLPQVNEKSQEINQFFLENFEELFAFADSYKHSRRKSIELVSSTYLNVIHSKSDIENIRSYSFNVLKRLCVSKFTGIRQINNTIDKYSLKHMLDYFDINLSTKAFEISEEQYNRIMEEVKSRLSDIEFETFFLYMNRLPTEDISELTGRSDKSIFTARDRYTKKLEAVKKLIRRRFF